MPEPSSTQSQIKEVLEFPSTADKRRAVDRGESRNDAAVNKYGTAVAAGTTVTLIVLNEDAEFYMEAQRLGHTLDLYDSTYTVKATGTGKTVTSVTHNAVTDRSTVTFTVAAAGATAAGDFFVRAGAFPDGRSYQSIERLDARLASFAPYTGAAGAQRLLNMTANDKKYALRMIDDRASGVARY